MAGFELSSLKEIGGVFRFGRGVLGKSAIAVGLVIVAVIVAVCRLHSDIAIILVILLAAAIFFLWFFQVLKFSSAHPDIALLEGAEWTGWKKFELEAKGSNLSPADALVVLPDPHHQEILLTPGVEDEDENEQH